MGLEKNNVANNKHRWEVNRQNLWWWYSCECFQKYWVISNSDFSGEFSLDNDHQINHLVCSLWIGDWKRRMEKWFLVLTFLSNPLAKTDPKNEEEEKRRIEARREKQRRRREKNSEKYGDGYRFVLSRVRKLDSLRHCFQDLRVGKLSKDGQKVQTSIIW